MLLKLVQHEPPIDAVESCWGKLLIWDYSFFEVFVLVSPSSYDVIILLSKLILVLVNYVCRITHNHLSQVPVWI